MKRISMIKKYLIKLFVSILLIVTGVLSSNAQPYKSTITGRVIDDYGQPLAGATIHLSLSDEVEGACWVSSDVETGRDGRFKLEEQCEQPTRKIFLFSISPGPNNVRPFLHPPFETMRHKDSNYAGIPFLVSENKSLDVGDVRVQIWYGTIELFITDRKGKPFYKTNNDWFQTKLVLRKLNGDYVEAEALSTDDVKKTVNQEKGSLLLSIPEGDWKIELIDEWEDLDSETGKTKKLLAHTKVKVKRSEFISSFRMTVK